MKNFTHSQPGKERNQRCLTTILNKKMPLASQAQSSMSIVQNFGRTLLPKN